MAWVKRVPDVSPDDVVSRLTFGFWPHLLDAEADAGGSPIAWGPILVDALPGHRYKAVAYWASQRNRDKLFARMDYCNWLRNRIAHLEPVWKAGPLLVEDRARQHFTPRIVAPAPRTPAEAIARMSLSYGRVLELMGWFSPELRATHAIGEAHYQFVSLNSLAALAAFRRHCGYRQARPVALWVPLP